MTTEKAMDYIVPDESIAGGVPLLAHRQYLRNPFTALDLTPGRRVLFTTKQESGGAIATDIRLEADDLEFRLDARESALGTIDRVVENRGFGFIKLLDGRRAFCHVSNVEGSQTIYAPGTRVQLDVVKTDKGWQALEVTRADRFRTQQGYRTDPSGAQDLLARAILARDAKNYGVARKLYRRGMSDAPSVQLVLSYAAFEKNQNDKAAAFAVYKEGISLFSKAAKLREDAGVLAGSMGKIDEAARLLLSALQLCRSTEQAGEMGVLLALARLYARQGTLEALRKALEFYRETTNLRPRKSLPSGDELAMNVIQIRLQHHRGHLTYRFLLKCGFEVAKANLLPAYTTGADLVAKIENAEIRESYGISGNVLVRCMFKSELERKDIDELDTTIEEYAETELISDQVVLLVLSSVPDQLKASLFRRIERRERSHVIIPIAQETMEAASEDERTGEARRSHLGILRSVLDTWLYRRDLFAHTYPVSGRRFFGRDRILAELREAIVSAKPSGIFGLRKVGKTSLLKECERRAIASGDIVVYVDLLRVPAGVDDARWLYWRIANLLFEQAKSRGQISMKWRLGGQCADYLDLPDELPVPVAFDADLSALVRSIEDAKWSIRPKVVILLDEIERILPTKHRSSEFSGFFDFLSYMRGFAQESQDVVIIITGANPAIVETSQFDGRDNPVFNFFQEVYLQLLEAEEIRLMMRVLGRGMGISFNARACERVVELTGGHPYFAREFCSFLARTYAERPLKVTEDRVDSIVDLYLEQVGGKDFGEIMDRLARDYPRERDICVEVAREATVDTSRGRLKHLVGYQLIEVQESRVVLTMELFRKWILEWL